MKTKLLSSLEQVIENWADNNCDEDDWFAGGVFYWPDDLNYLMAQAAAAVYDANRSGQVCCESDSGS